MDDNKEQSNVVIVTGCKDCPFLIEVNFTPFCNLMEYNSNNKYGQDFEIEREDSGEELNYIEWLVTPDWCPLNKEPITIIKK